MGVRHRARQAQHAVAPGDDDRAIGGHARGQVLGQAVQLDGDWIERLGGGAALRDDARHPAGDVRAGERIEEKLHRLAGRHQWIVLLHHRGLQLQRPGTGDGHQRRAGHDALAWRGAHRQHHAIERGLHVEAG